MLRVKIWQTKKNPSPLKKHEHYGYVGEYMKLTKAASLPPHRRRGESLCEFIYLNLNPICIPCTNKHFYAKLNIVSVYVYVCLYNDSIYEKEINRKSVGFHMCDTTKPETEKAI